MLDASSCRNRAASTATAATGLVCELRRAATAFALRAADAPLVIGHHSALSGTNQALGTHMKLGIELAFDEQNAAGGIRGRKLELEFRDDAYDPATAEAAARALVDVQVDERARRTARRR